MASKNDEKVSNGTNTADQKKRLDYLLQQAGLFSHFMTQSSPVKKDRRIGRPKTKE